MSFYQKIIFYIIKNGNLTIECLDNGYNVSTILSEIKIYGVNQKPTQIWINNHFYYDFDYNDFLKVNKHI